MSNKYIENSLIKDEKILKSASVSVKILIPPIVWALVISFSCILFGWGFLAFLTRLIFFSIVFSIRRIIAICTTELAFTNKRVLSKRGLFKRETEELRNSKVESMYVHQGFWEYLLNYGSITIRGAGNATRIYYIDNPVKFKNEFNSFLVFSR